jgi:hypothetical protein
LLRELVRLLDVGSRHVLRLLVQVGQLRLELPLRPLGARMTFSVRLTGLLAALAAAAGLVAAASLAHLDVASWRVALLVGLGATSGALGARTD